ncbi:hypothetical protein PTKU46_88440 [Paraburkholderia terrae]|jgi:hypothetical protein|uniref:Tautomerase n=2 Tax=Paraburkholderia TaxID=1822464 RepID=A0A7Z7BLU6_9BURK|nr:MULTISPECIES: hypothetical protein [Paraburkholderia]SDJ55195.1 hypothetical protein SAMN04487926_16213 [Paraburkholderia steynii]BCZ84713.1 hypothetical protein PTKU64_83880 [Paraburkholderia terrae]BDC45412.1 hypothetical protein PTKU15_87090 [Paraburkholderia terrae]BDC46089.1 hypothetical protein PTKU15_93860 [Paraburkholderia terrae]HKR39127.1 hypothetical protein [Paraburkholderia sp.]
MEFDTDWLTLGPHRVRLRSTRGFPTEAMRKAVEVVRIAVDNNMSARARLVEVVCRQEKIYEVTIGTTIAKDKICAPQLETFIAGVLGLPPDHIDLIVTTVEQSEVDLHFGVYERMLAEKLGTAPPLQ